MQIKKLLKYLPIAVMAAGLVAATSTIPLFSQNNSEYLENQIYYVDQQVADAHFSDQFVYIRNDVAKQDDVTNSVASIKIADSSSNTNHSAALVTKTDGSTLLYMWGNNYYGQLGNGTKDNTSTPTLVDATPFGTNKISQIVLGQDHSAALLDDGSLYMWGLNSGGQLGNGSTSNASTPTQVDITNFNGKKINHVALGNYHSGAILEDGSLYMWGGNWYGQLGNRTNINSTNPNPVPIEVTINPVSTVTQIALGAEYSSVVTENGSLYMWGYNNYGQLGFPFVSNANPDPTLVSPTYFSFPIKRIVLGGSQSAALLDDGSLYMWGANNFGQLGFNVNVTPNPTPTEVSIPNSGLEKIDEIALGSSHSAALLDDGRLYMWGRNYWGQLGTAIGDVNYTPTQVSDTYFTSKITQIVLGAHYSTALLKDDSFYMWGANNYGQLGFTTNNTPNPTPTWMSQLGKNSHITAKSAITAQAAVDSIWVDDKFDLTGFKNSFNLINIPDVANQDITMDTKPTYDNATGTVVMNVKIKYFYNEDGLIVPDTSTEAMTITGFADPANEDKFPWWWIVIGIGGAAIIGVGIWFVIKKRKEAEAKYVDGEPEPE